MPKPQQPATPETARLFHIGELAKTVGKTVRALHLYEELGLLAPSGRSKGGFRLYDTAAVERVSWIIKLQDIGFTLAQIQEFVRDFGGAPSGRDAAGHVRATFEGKLADVREQIARLEESQRDLEDALAYLRACTGCSPSYAPAECHDCNHHGHEPAKVPHLFAGLSESTATGDYDVPITTLTTERDDGDSHGVQ